MSPPDRSKLVQQTANKIPIAVARSKLKQKIMRYMGGASEAEMLNVN